MENKFFTSAEIKYFFDALKSGKNVGWPIISYLLLSVEHHQIWHADSKSFTAWVKTFSREIKKQESSCWRYLAAAKYYLQLKEVFNNKGIDSPFITALSENVSAENIEILEKLQRVMPDEQFLVYALRTIKNNVKRQELRQLWSIYRPLLEGRTARGQKVSPIININDRYQFDSQAEAVGITSLIKSDGAWAKKKSSDIYKTFREIKLPINISGKSFTFVPDLFVLTGSRESNDLFIHVVEYTSLINNQRKVEKLIAVSRKVNFTWIMYPSHLNIEVESLLPKEFGLIALLGHESFVVHREASYTAIEQTCVLKKILFNII